MVFGSQAFPCLSRTCLGKTTCLHRLQKVDRDTVFFYRQYLRTPRLQALLHVRSVQRGHCAVAALEATVAPLRDTTSFSAFPMFCPSLSWRNDHF
eukprot:COSAG06_NODE_20238_length_803_cov_1.038352_1_plen_94_part_10